MPRWPDYSILERILARVEVNEDGCMIYTGSLDTTGYARITVGKTTISAHRAMYEAFVGPIPAGLQLDHVRARGCRSKACVNPAHLEPVTQRENIMRGDSVTVVAASRTHCPSGHEYTPENTRLYRGHRYCRACHNIRSAERRRRRAGKVAA